MTYQNNWFLYNKSLPLDQQPKLPTTVSYNANLTGRMLFLAIAVASTLLWSTEGMASSPIASDSVAIATGRMIGRLETCNAMPQDELRKELEWSIAKIILQTKSPESIKRVLDLFEESRRKAIEQPNSLYTCDMALERLKNAQQSRKKYFEENAKEE